MSETNKNLTSLMSVEFSKYIPIDIKPIIGRKWILNGDDNKNFNRYKDAYDDSTTNGAIINSFIKYIFAEGLQDKNGKVSYNAEGEEILNTKVLNVEKYISSEDVLLIVGDLKKYGQASYQVIWNSAKNEADKKPIQLKYIPVRKLGLNTDEMLNVNGYWYTYDWGNKTKYPPMLYSKFDGIYKGNDVEILSFKLPCEDAFFAIPDWFQGLFWAEVEGKLGHSSINYIDNKFQGAKMINFNNGIPPEEQQQAIKSKIGADLKGTQNTNKYFLTFNESKETAPEILDLSSGQLDQQYSYFSEEAERKLISIHNAPPVLYTPSRDGGGLGNNADEIEMATAKMYRETINPMRHILLKGFDLAFKFMNPDIKLAFKDFETFNGEKRQQIASVNMANENVGNKIGFDFDETANTSKGIKLIEEAISMGKEIYLISARDSDTELKDFAQKHNINLSNVYATGSNINKIEKVKELKLNEFYDNNNQVISQLTGIGKLFTL